jgi:cellulose synthase/poly-beta-1,6-N-acetylglucosamine synthase-like glycosyltransferase
MVTGLSVVLSIVFMAWIALRLLGLLAAARPPPPRPRRPDACLPAYTVIVALYREVAAVEQLIASLDALDWPPEKLDIKLVLEPDDDATRTALEAMRLGRPYELVIAPDIGPRTKPKALNSALPFARGAFVTVFDAEDRPEPDQLRRALDAFLSHDDRLACVTEDADLGMRLARFGYMSAVIASTTYEEAPAKFSAWLKQRRRWFQGWMRPVK